MADGSVVAVSPSPLRRSARRFRLVARPRRPLRRRPHRRRRVRRRTASACRSRSRRPSAGSPSGSATTMPTTSSSLPRLMPLTPRVLRPIARASASSKRIAMPLRVRQHDLVARLASGTTSISVVALVEADADDAALPRRGCTSISVGLLDRSPCASPSAGGSPSSNSRTGMTLVIFSSGLSDSTLAMRPARRLVRLACGMS